MFYLLTPEEEAACLSTARFVLWDGSADMAGNNCAPVKKNWYKDVRHSWDRIATNKAKPSDEDTRNMVFALKHRVCGPAKIIDLYLKSAANAEDELLTYANYVSKQHPDIEEERKNTTLVLMKQKPSYSLEEICWLAANVKLFKKIAPLKRLQSNKACRSGKPSAGGSSSIGKGAGKNSATVASDSGTVSGPTALRIIKMFSSLNTDCQALNVVNFNIEKGVTLKTVKWPQSHGATLRYMIKPILVVAAESAVYDHILDIIYPNETSSPEVLVMKASAKGGMKYLLELQDKNTGPTVELDSLAVSVEYLEACQKKKKEKETGHDSVSESLQQSSSKSDQTAILYEAADASTKASKSTLSQEQKPKRKKQKALKSAALISQVHNSGGAGINSQKSTQPFTLAPMQSLQSGLLGTCSADAHDGNTTFPHNSHQPGQISKSSKTKTVAVKKLGKVNPSKPAKKTLTSKAASALKKAVSNAALDSGDETENDDTNSVLQSKSGTENNREGRSVSPKVVDLCTLSPDVQRDKTNKKKKKKRIEHTSTNII